MNDPHSPEPFGEPTSGSEASWLHELADLPDAAWTAGARSSDPDAALRAGLRWQTRRRRVRQLAAGVALTLAFSAGALWSPRRAVEPDPGAPRSTEELPSARPEVPADDPPRPSTEPTEEQRAPLRGLANASPDELERAARSLSGEGRSGALARAGDAYLNMNADVAAALRCYRDALDGEHAPRVEQPSWLLAALLDARAGL